MVFYTISFFIKDIATTKLIPASIPKYDASFSANKEISENSPARIISDINVKELNENKML